MKATAIAFSLVGQFVGKTDTAVASCGQGDDGKFRADETRDFGALIFYTNEDADGVGLKEGIDSSDGITLVDEPENEQKNGAEIDENLVTAEATAAQMTSAAQMLQASALFTQSGDSGTKNDALGPVDTDLTHASNAAWETDNSESNVSDVISDTIAENSPFSELVSESLSNELDAENTGFISSNDDSMYQLPASDTARRASSRNDDVRFGNLRTDTSGESIRDLSSENANANSTSVFIERVLNSLRSSVAEESNSDMVSDTGINNTSESESSQVNKSKTSGETSSVIAGFTAVTSEAANASDEIDKSSAVRKALDNFVNDFRGIEAGESEIHITLEPESLGKLSIFMSQSEKGLSIEIRSNDLEICASLLGQVDSVISAIQDHGIQLDSFDVRYMDSGASSYGSEGSREQSGSYNREQPSYRNPVIDAILRDDDSKKYIFMMHDYYYYDTEAVGSIEYRI